MEEVPASPESLRQRRSGRKTNYFKRRKRSSLICDKNITESTKCPATGGTSSLTNAPERVDTTEPVVYSVKQTDINLLYFDDDSDIEFVNEDPLASARMLEKANQIELDGKVQHSEEFLLNVRNRFVKIKDLIEPENSTVKVEVKQETSVQTPKKANYSYTQFDLDSEMLGVCEAADILASLNKNPIDEIKDWNSPSKSVVCNKTPETLTSVAAGKNRWSNIRQCSLFRDCTRTSDGCPSPSRMNALTYTIVNDFSDDGTETETNIDYSKIKSERLRRRLIKIQSDINSPPQLVNKSSIRRTYSRKKQVRKRTSTPRMAAVRRLSYEDKDFSSDDEIKSFESLDTDSVDEIPQETPCNSDDNLVSSFLIKENLRQLSQIFSRSNNSQEKSEQDSGSLNRELPFNRFSPESTKPISLPASKSNESLHILKVDWLFRSDSESEREYCSEMNEEHNFDGVHRLLDDDDDFLVQLNSSPRNEYADSMIVKVEINMAVSKVVQSNNPISTKRCIPPLADIDHDREILASKRYKTKTTKPPTSTAGDFPSASVSTTHITGNIPLENLPEKDACAPVNTDVVPPVVGFSTARGNKIAVSEEALQKAQVLWEDFDDYPSKAESASSKILAKNVAMPPFVGFNTAGGSSIAVSKGAFEKAITLWNNLETEMTSNDVPAIKEEVPFCAGFSTAGRSTIAVSKDALEKVKTFWNDFEDSTNDEKKAIPSSIGFTTAGGNTIAVSNNALEKAKFLWNNLEDSLKDEKSPKKGEVPSFAGFKTAGGSTIAISKDAHAKAEALWSDFEHFPSKDEKASNYIFAKKEKMPPFAGFSTAGESSIVVPKGALEKTQTLRNNFDDDMSSDSVHVKKEKVPSFAGFRTAGGSTIAISANAIEKTKALWNDLEVPSRDEMASNEILANKMKFRTETVERNQTSTDVVPPFAGFSTAEGNTITVPQNALDKAKTLWNDCDDSFVNEKSSSNVLAQNVPCRNETLKRVPDEDCDPKTPSKRFKLNDARNVTRFSTSTPNFPLKGPHPEGQQADEIVAVEQFFADLDDREFQHMLCGSETVSTNSNRARPLKQVCLMNRFEENNPSELSLSGVVQWDDSFGEAVANLSAGVTDGLKPAQHILDARGQARKRQMEYIKTKPESERKPRMNVFVEKKLQSERCTIQKYVGGCKPSPKDLGDVSERIRMVTAENVANFKFDMVSLYGRSHCLENIDGFPLGDPDATINLIEDDYCQAGLREISSTFLAAPGIDPTLVPDGWIENAWKWIVLKLSSMERNLSSHFHGITTPDNVYNQLLYRYHVEINCVKRSVIRKMLEKDDIPSKRMVLFVSRVFRGQSLFEAEIELSDGWYALRAIIDPPLTLAISKGMIAVGTKLMIQGAELVNLTEGCTPLQLPSDVRLRIHANSTRRARWFCKLGLYEVPNSFLVPCNNILDNGGLVTRLQAVVIRVYPMLYVDQTKNGSLGSVLRSERAERRCSVTNDAARFENFQKLFSQIQKEIEVEKSEKLVHKSKSLLYKSASTAELLELIDAGLDISCIEIDISATQRDVILEHHRRKQEENLQEINRRVKERMKDQNRRQNVTPMLKARVMDARAPDKILLLTIWRPPEHLNEIIQERKILEICNTKANGTRNGELQLTAGKSCTYNLLNQPQIELPVERFRKLTKISEIDVTNFRPPFNELDTIGVVVHIGNFEANRFQTIYVANLSMNLLRINFWSGIRAFAYEDVVKPLAVLCISNLQWRPINASSVIPIAFASECTTFSESSKAIHFVDELQNFHSSLATIDLELFSNECCQRIEQIKERNLSRISNGRTSMQNRHGTSSIECSTPLRSVLSSINSTEQTRTHPSPSVGQSTSLQKRKIEQLAAAYKSPPKLSPIIMRSNPRARRSFKTPARLDRRIESTHRDDTL
ncbi:breast cancer type 2 susceptibility protein homolog [Toxorhynchites rutilus septentrionalis]|uniref:breast cancer type 2 susceptibility protein homolog n=1 Tax=Toxorhynchites rutilus septentrionalis TaxID=329112 RepID=UPI00247A9E62|nr:breast cancer type 2 susceptibility protein homolog [Toxorhynchites rutilus septentrionalis]